MKFHDSLLSDVPGQLIIVFRNQLQLARNFSRGAEAIRPLQGTIRPNCPLAISSVACPPIRVERLRSKGVGEPPR